MKEAGCATSPSILLKSALLPEDLAPRGDRAEAGALGHCAMRRLSPGLLVTHRSVEKGLSDELLFY